MSDPRLNIDQQRFLLKLARDAIRYHFESGKPPPVAAEEGALKEKRGAFVTLKREEELRGCMRSRKNGALLSPSSVRRSCAAASAIPCRTTRSTSPSWRPQSWPPPTTIASRR